MKLYKFFLTTCILAAGVALPSCDDDDMFEEAGKEAIILGGDNLNCLKVVGASGVTWKSTMEGNTITILINPDLDAFEEIGNVVPKFFVSKGAIVDPDPGIAQDFTVEGA